MDVCLEHFHEGNMTNKSNGIQSKVPELFVEVSPELAKEREIQDGSLVRLVSPFGAVKLHALDHRPCKSKRAVSSNELRR